MENEFKVGMLVRDTEGVVILVTKDVLPVLNKYRKDYTIWDEKIDWRNDFKSIETGVVVNMCAHDGRTPICNFKTKTLLSKLHKNYVAWRADTVIKQVDNDGKIRYFKNGLRHREDGPALIWPNNTGLFWYQNDVLHREDGPAVVKITGETTEVKYYLHGKEVENVFPVEDRDTFRIYNQHDDVGTTIIVNRELSTVIDGNQYHDYTEHSSNGDGVVFFYKNGYLHNEDGPAFIGETETYYLDGVYHTKENWELSTGKVPELTLDEVEDRLGYKIKLVDEVK
jgi:hypothetical protein